MEDTKYYEIHHIVPRNADKCEKSRQYLKKYILDGVENFANLMILAKPHQSIHTNNYYRIVNNTVVEAVELVQCKQSKQIEDYACEIAVYSALAILRVEIRGGMFNGNIR